MKTFIIQEKFVGYADVHIDAETEEEAMRLYKLGEYDDYEHDMDDFTDYEFYSIKEAV